MYRHDRLNQTAAFCCGLLAVGWIGGVFGACLYKTAYWFAFDAWPGTGLYGLVPGAAVRWVLTLPKDDFGTRALLFLLNGDLLTYIAVVPPLLLAPCLAWLLARQGPRQTWRMATRPFAPTDRQARVQAPGADFFRRNRGLPGSGASR